MATYSKLLAEHLIVTGSNDKFVVANSTGGNETITITSQRYRDISDLGDEIEDQLDSGTNSSTQQWTFSTSNSTGLVTLTSNEAFTLYFDTTNYGTALRDKLGFESNTIASTSNAVSGTLQHEGGFYPSDPIEADSRPSESGSDTYDTDFQATVGRTGAVFGRGGGENIYFRDFMVLLQQSDLSNYSTFISYLKDGRSFAFYHDRDEAWPGPSNEYCEYVLLDTGNGTISYNPQPLNPANKIWHRGVFSCNKYVEP